MRDRDPLTWSIPLPWRPLGVTVRVHVIFPVVVLGLVLAVATGKQFDHDLWGQACVVMVLLFVCVLLHEMGHVIAARRLDGDAEEVLLWPLGGLTFVDVPRVPRAFCWSALAGPAVNLSLAAAAGGALVALGFVPPLNPLASPINPTMYSWNQGIKYYSRANPGEPQYWFYHDAETGRPQQVDIYFEKRKTDDGKESNTVFIRESKPQVETVGEQPNASVVLQGKPGIVLERALLNRWQWLLAQVFLVNWFLLAVNLIPAFPLDAGRLAQCFFWRKTDYRQATASAAYVGFLFMLLVGIYAIAVNDLLPALLAVVIYACCRRELYQLEEAEERASAGYDFSQGYSSLERDDEDGPAAPPPAPPPKQNWLQRWLTKRGERRLERERSQRQADERRLDDLLEKILREGKQALNDEELRFLTKMSSRYPNRK
jgi:Zn-dependent protease